MAAWSFVASPLPRAAVALGFTTVAAVAQEVVRGDPSCWQDGYDFEACCGTNATSYCWDGEFTEDRCCRDTFVDLDRPVAVLDEDIGDAFGRTTAYAAEGPLGCPDKPRGLWQVVKTYSVVLNVSRLYGMPAEKPPMDDMALIIRHVKEWVRDGRAWLDSKEACPVGALNAIDLVAARLDKVEGEALTKAAYKLHQGLLSDLEKEGAWPSQTGWPVLASGFEYAPRLLGLAPRHACHGTSLRIFMYDLEKFRHMVHPVLTCSQKMSQCTASVHIHRWLASGSCLTDDPSEADLFFLPAYEACYNETACGFDNNTERCFSQDFDPSVDLQYFDRRRGTDHMFMFGCNLLPLHDPMMIKTRNSVMVTVESFQAENVEGPNMLAWLSLWKDVLIPGYIPAWRISAMLAFNRPVLKRPTLLAFHGHSGRSPNVGSIYKRSPLAAIRDRVIEHFWNISGASVGPPARDFFRRMGRSKFCLIPAGLTAWTIHLYESFFFGCVPVILSDELVVPFQQEVDWPSLSVQVPTNISMEELHTRLAGFSIGRLKAMHRALGRARCWFDYSQGWGTEGSLATGCSPYRALLSGLAVRARRVGELYPLRAMWSPPPSTDA